MERFKSKDIFERGLTELQFFGPRMFETVQTGAPVMGLLKHSCNFSKWMHKGIPSLLPSPGPEVPVIM